jgi:GNAT superfamily N-acetyltransferase
MHLRPLAASDVPTVAAAWNEMLPSDRTTEERFRAVVLGDPNHEQEGALMAEGAGGELLGFSAHVVRRTVKGGDGGGREANFRRGFLKAFLAADGDGGGEAAAQLLAAGERYCAAAGKSEITVTEYSGPYFFPGIDVRYERLREVLACHGYRDVATIEDVGVSLLDAGLDRRVSRAHARPGPGLTVCTWDPDLLRDMRRFVAEGDHPEWFPEGWEGGLAAPREQVLILREGEEIVGWAQYWPARPCASFGPILVLERARHRGFGSLLLLECMARARAAGAERMEAGWANTGFYTANGWHVTRRYAVLRKQLHPGGTHP